MINKQYKINTPNVIGEVIEGEAVIMDLKQGYYYSCSITASDIWEGLEENYDLDTILQLLLHKYQADKPFIQQSLLTFIEKLVEVELIQEVDIQAQQVLALTDNNEKNSFIIPELTVYTDMQDLLLLDPIHDVDEGGWPMPKEE